MKDIPFHWRTGRDIILPFKEWGCANKQRPSNCWVSVLHVHCVFVCVCSVGGGTTAFLTRLLISFLKKTWHIVLKCVVNYTNCANVYYSKKVGKVMSPHFCPQNTHPIGYSILFLKWPKISKAPALTHLLHTLLHRPNFPMFHVQ